MAYRNIDLHVYMWGRPKNLGTHLSLLYNINITPDLRQTMVMGFIMRIRKVYQKSIEARNNCCLPACISSLTGIPMREVSYQPRHTRKCWYTHIREFLKSRGFELRKLHPEQVDLDTFYIKCYEFQVDDEDLTAHAVVTRGYEIVHNPAEFIKKKITPRECTVSYGKEYYFEIWKKDKA